MVTGMEETKEAAPLQTLSLIDAIALIVGVVIGAGIFKTPSLVAANTETESLYYLAWLAGGGISLVGALCYAELATTYPHSGGDYHYLYRAFGKKVAFLFGWARVTVIQPGSIAMLAFVFGDYISQVQPFLSPSMCALLAVLGLTVMNLMGTKKGAGAQNILTAAKVIGLVAVLATGIIFASPQPLPETGARNPQASFGLAMVFVLLTFGGWNEAAYISAELREGKRSMVRSLLWGLGIITAIYLLAGFACLKGLGFAAVSQSEAVAADLMRKAFGEGGAKFVSFLIAVSALGAVNATIFTGARTNYALGRDFDMFHFLGRWQEKSNTPTNALLFQGGVTSILVLLGFLTRKGFVTMVDFTAPIFWLFFLLTGVSLFILRKREPDISRPFRVPLYPAIPFLFCASCLFMLRSSIAYTGIGALLGIVVFLAGVLLLPSRIRHKGSLN
jgi:basic amino acid/polyamine antiporter, APA family